MGLVTKKKKSSLGDKIRGPCILCRRSVTREAMRFSSSEYNILAVMLSSNVVYGGIDVGHAKFTFETCVAVPKRLCHRHFSDGAKFLVTELMPMGVSFSYYEDDSILLGSVAYVNQRDIPKSMVDCLNEVVVILDKDRRVTARDVTRFINDSLRHYYSVRGWDSVSRVLPRMRRKQPEKKKTLADKVRGECILCGQTVFHKAMRFSSSEYNILAVMLSSNVVYGEIDLGHAKFTFEACVAVRKRLCHRHFSDGAKFLVAELMAMNVSFSYYEDDSVLHGTVAYVNQRDIPKSMVDSLNEVVLRLDKDRRVTSRDVTRFINDSLRIYYSVKGWNSESRVLPRMNRKQPEKEKASFEEGLQEPLYSNDFKKEEESENADYGIPLSELAGQSCSSSSLVEAEPNSHVSKAEPSSSPDLVRLLPRLEKTDPVYLQHSFIVDGEALLKLFQFCPQCGQKLEADGAVRLVMDGSAPVVQYVCERCSQEEPIIKSWKAQEDRA